MGGSVAGAEVCRKAVAWRVRGPVIDKTGLTGLFDASISYVPGEPNEPGFIAALQQQLGLEIESTRGPDAVLVIDSIQQPTEN